jgi:RimJ/RimL family protein N-acetyltransferase
MNAELEVSVRPYAAGDQWLLEKTLGDAAQMVHLNGPERIEQIRQRHSKFVAMSSDPSSGCQFTILAGPRRDPAGNVGYWDGEWKGETGWEVGWFVLPEFQGHGVATAATRLIVAKMAKESSRRFVFAFPSVENHPSNAICRKLGFALLEPVTAEYPAGSHRSLTVNVWKLTLPG